MIKVYSLSGSHDVGKTTIFTRLKKLLRSHRFAFVGEFADCLLKQMNIRDVWKETIQRDAEAYNYFETALDFVTVASYLLYKDKAIIADRSLVDNCAYRLCVGLPLNTISLLRFYNVNLYTFFVRSKQEDATVTNAVAEVLKRFSLPYEEVWVIEGKPNETAESVAHRIQEIERQNSHQPK